MLREISEEVRVNLKDRLREARQQIRRHRHDSSASRSRPPFPFGEIEGLHHGLHREGMWWWQTLGYTPAGIELWNAMRALDYLETRREVDPKRLGVTGRSGGGATRLASG